MDAFLLKSDKKLRIHTNTKCSWIKQAKDQTLIKITIDDDDVGEDKAPLCDRCHTKTREEKAIELIATLQEFDLTASELYDVYARNMLQVALQHRYGVIMREKRYDYPSIRIRHIKGFYVPTKLKSRFDEKDLHESEHRG